MSRRGDKVVFVPNGPSRRETAIMLVGTAKEHGLGDDAVHMEAGGFFISDDLADILYDEDVLEEEVDSTEDAASVSTAPGSSTASDNKTSGSRAAKNKNSNKEE